MKTEERRITSTIDHPSGHRMIGIDILRFVLEFTVFAFHSHIHIDCQWGVITPFFSMGTVMMTPFFMLSVFSLWNTYCRADLIGGIKNFLKKELYRLFQDTFLWRSCTVY